MPVVKILRSTVTGHVPSALISGQIAVNEADDVLFWLHSDGTIKSCKLGLAEQLMAGAPAALDTLKELADAINDDASFAATVTTALSSRLRVDTPSQGLSSTQQANARTNLGLGTAALKDAGSAANNVVQLDANGRLPALDGSQLTNLGGFALALAVQKATAL